MPIKKLLKESQIDPSDTVEFYHVSNDVHFMKDFLDNGAKAIGKGVGGQKTGFYVFPTRKQAEKHVVFKDKIRMSNGNTMGGNFSKDGGLLVGVRIPKQLLRCPDWQIDYENAKCLAPLFEKYRDKIEELKNIPVQTKLGIQNYSMRKRLPDPLDPSRFYKPSRFRYIYGKTEIRESFGLDDEGAEKSGLIQAICDNLCRDHADFRNEYNQLLKEVAQSGKGTLKYTGEKTLPISHLSLIQGDQKGNFEETVLYTDQKPKEKQVCPFVTAGLKIKASQKQ